MSETYPRKNLRETLFAGHIPSSVGFDCKGTKKIAYAQVLCNFLFRGGDLLAGKSARTKQGRAGSGALRCG